jgi:hypothetical protein
MNLARSWPRLEELWQETEHIQVKYGYPKNFRFNIKIVCAVTLTIALGKLYADYKLIFNCVVLCVVCVYICTVLLPPVVNPVGVNKYLSNTININYNYAL